VFIEAKDDGGGGDNWTTGAISRAKLQSNHHGHMYNVCGTITTNKPTSSFSYKPDAILVAQSTMSKQ